MKSAFRRAAGPRNRVPVPIGPAGPLTTSRLFGGSLYANDQEALMRAMSVMSTVNSCVSLISDAASRPEWKLYRKQPQDARRRYASTDTGSDQRVEVTNHAALTLMGRPNAFYTRKRLFETSQMYLDLTGESYWVVSRDGGATFPTQLWPVRPDRMFPIPDPDNFLAGWIYVSPDGGERVLLGVDEVIQSVYPNPFDPYHGLGPVQALLPDIDSARYSAEWNRAFFLNGATPDGVITLPEGMEDDARKQFADQWREMHRGVSQAHRVAVLESGATWTPNQMTIRDMDFAALRGLTRDIVREAYKMHKVMLGVSDDVNRANAQTGEEVFASWGIVPRLDRWRDLLNFTLLPMFGSAGEQVEFDYQTPVPANREEDRLEMAAKAQSANVLVNAGYDPHDVLEVVGLPDMDVAEKAVQGDVAPPGWMPIPPAGGTAEPAPASAGGAATPDAAALNHFMRMLSNSVRL